MKELADLPFFSRRSSRDSPGTWVDPPPGCRVILLWGSTAAFQAARNYAVAQTVPRRPDDNDTLVVFATHSRYLFPFAGKRQRMFYLDQESAAFELDIAADPYWPFRQEELDDTRRQLGLTER